MDLTEEQILNLAPDESSKKSGRDLANPAKWVSKGVSEKALWGECQGSGSKPYQTQIDLTDLAFKCSCPSRKFPCKHGLGLFLFYARQKNSFANGTEPAWVAEWLNKRSEKQEKKAAAKDDKPVDEDAKEKRQQARTTKVADGITELQLWIKDIVRNGLLNMPDKGPAWFANTAKRMVDAQAPGLANLVTQLGDTSFYADGWQNQFLRQLLNMYLLSKGFQHIEHLDEPMQQEIKTWIGFAQNQEALREQTGIMDTWLVLAKQSSEADNITTERYWLYGTNSHQYALILQFIVRNGFAANQLSIVPGQFIQAELVYFPSVNPLRALVKRQINAAPVATYRCAANWEEVANAETELVSSMPVQSDRPWLVQQLRPVQERGAWWLADKDNHIMSLRCAQPILWQLLALSGGEAADLAVIGRQGVYAPAGIWKEGHYTSL